MDDFFACWAGTIFFFLLFGLIAGLRYISYRETLALAEKGLVRPEKRNGKGALVWGIMITSVGVALCIGLWPIGFLVGGNSFPMLLGPWLLPGLLPIFFGLGLILVYVLTREAQEKPAAAPPAGEGLPGPASSGAPASADEPPA